MKDERPRGIDVSQWNVEPHGFDFVWIRASSAEGGLHEDSAYARHVDEARRTGTLFGAYHFAANGERAFDQARFFRDVVHKHAAAGHGPHLGNVIDLEGALTPEVGKAVVGAAVEEFRHDADPRVGIYSGGWVKAIGGPTLGAHFGWLAYWNGGAPGTIALPAHWSRRFTRFWQYEVAGTPRLDRDLFCGTRRGLIRWAQIQ